MKTEKILATILFADVKGYSQLTEHQLIQFGEAELPLLAEIVKKGNPLYVNSWGDAVVAAYQDPLATARCALELRDLFRNTNWPEKGLPPALNIRIALHAGTIFVGRDPIRDERGLIGTQVNLAARIEPITRAGQIWATSQFVTFLEQCEDKTIAVDDLGERPLAKKWGSERLFRIRRTVEPSDALYDVEEPIPATFDAVEMATEIFRQTTNEAEKARALELLGQSGDARSVPLLLEVLKDKTASVALRNKAAFALGHLKQSVAVPDMVDVVKDEEDDLDVRDTIVVALGEIGDLRASETLLEVAANKIPMPVISRARAISSLGELKDTRYVSQVIDLLRGEVTDETIIRSVILFVHSVKDIRGVSALLQIAGNKEKYSERTRGAAVRGVIEIAPERAVDAMTQLTKDPEETHRIKSIAIAGLAKAKTAASTRRLQEIAAEPMNPHATWALALLLNPKKYLEEEED